MVKVTALLTSIRLTKIRYLVRFHQMTSGFLYSSLFTITVARKHNNSTEKFISNYRNSGNDVCKFCVLIS